MPSPQTPSTNTSQLLDDARIEASRLIRSFFDEAQDDLAQAALLRVYPQIDGLQALAALQQIGEGEWPGIRLVAAEDLPGGHAAYVADLDLILVSESVFAIEATEPGFLAGVLLEEIGHYLDDQYSPVDTAGDEGAAFRALVQSGGSVVIEPDDGDDAGEISLDGEDYLVELASLRDSGGYEGSQETIALEGDGDNVLDFSFEFYSIPDRFIVRYDGKTVFDSGFTGGSQSGQIKIERGNSDVVEVIVATDNQGTAWDYAVSTEEDDECPDTSPLIVTPVGGEFEHKDDDSCEYTGTVIIGRKDGLQSMLRVEGGTVRIDANQVTVTNGTVYGAAGGFSDVLFAGSFSIPYATGVAGGLSGISQVYSVGGMETELQGFTINRDKVLLDTAFELPGDLGSQAVNGQVIPSDILVLSNQGLQFGGVNGQVRLPDVNFSFFELFDVKSTNQTLAYVSSLDEIRYQGKFVIDAPIKGVDNSLTVDLLDPNYAGVRGGEAEFKGKLELETDVSLGKFAFKGFAIEIDTTSDPETIKGATTFEFPMKARSPELEATLGFALDPFTINTVGLEADKLNIPVPGVSLLFLNKLGLTLDHLAPHDTAGFTIEGLVGFTFGPKITLPAVFGISQSDLALVSADITGTVGADGLGGGASVSIINEGILNIAGKSELNWTDKFVSYEGTGSLFKAVGGGIANGTMKGKADASFNLGVSGVAQVQIPDLDIFHAFGGMSLGTGNVVMAFTNDGLYSNDFGAAWGTIDIDLPLFPKTSILVGAKIKLDGSMSVLNQANLPTAGQAGFAFASAAAAAAAAPAAADTEGFEVAGGTPYILMFVEWSEIDAVAPELAVTRPDGVVISQADFADNNIAIVPELSAPGKLGVFVGGTGGDGLDGGVWNIGPVNADGLGDVSTIATAPVNNDDMAVSIVDVGASGGNIVIDYDVETTSGNGEIALFYDEDGEGYDGTPIATGLAFDGEPFEWDTIGLPTGQYYIYAAYTPDNGAPIFSDLYYSTPVDITARGADLAVSTSLKSTGVDVDSSGLVSYQITVANNGQEAAENVLITEDFDDGLYYYASTSAGNPGYLTNSEFTLDLGTLAAGDSRTIDVSLYLTSRTSAEANHQTVASTSTPDIDIFNNADDGSASYYHGNEQDPVIGDLAVAVETADPGGVIGDTSGYTLRITNNGDEDMQGVRLDEYVLGYRDATYAVDGGAWGAINSSAVTRINVGTIAAGESKLVEISGIIQAAGQTISTSEVSSDFVTDPDSTNNTLVQYRNGEVATIDHADVSVTGSVSNANPVAGDTVTLTVDLNNVGPNVASGLQVRIDVSDGIEIQSGTPGVQGTFDVDTGIWDVGNMRDNLTRSLTVTILVNDPQDAYAAAQVIALGEPDPDSEPDNGYVGEDDEFVFFGTPPSGEEPGEPEEPEEPGPWPEWPELPEQPEEPEEPEQPEEPEEPEEPSEPEEPQEPEPDGVTFVSPHEDRDEVIEGSEHDDYLDGRGGNDRFVLLGGDDEVLGGDGLDTAVFDFALAEANIVVTGNAQLQVAGPNGISILSSVEVLEFTDTSLGYLSQDEFAGIAGLYLAALDRAPDLGGLAYWYGESQGGATISEIAASFVNTDEFLALHGGGSDADWVMSLYQSVLHREHDQAGLDYWVGEMQNGMTTADLLAFFVQSDESQTHVAHLDGLELV